MCERLGERDRVLATRSRPCGHRLLRRSRIWYDSGMDQPSPVKGPTVTIIPTSAGASPSERTSLYLSAGKQEFRLLLANLAEKDGVRTVGTFYGTGIDSRLFASRGLDVTATEIVRRLWPVMDADADANGFRTFHGNAAKIDQRFDMFHADFIGNASPIAFRTLRRVANITDRWLAVTLAPDHQINPWIQGEAALYAVPAWLTGATGFTLEYFGRYARNGSGQTMFVALLRRCIGKGNWHPVQALQIAYSVGERQYWSSRTFYETELVRHRYAPRNEREKASDRKRYLQHRYQASQQDCLGCRSSFTRRGGPQRYCSDACRKPARRAQTRAAVRRWNEKRRLIVAQPPKPSNSGSFAA